MAAVERNRHIAGAGTSAQAWLADAGIASVPSIALDDLVAPHARAVVVAPHPDDEILSCGALLDQLARRGQDVLVVAVTDGEASHPGSPAWPRAYLRATRRAETTAALACIGVKPDQVLRLEVPDGGVAARQAALQARLTAILRPGDVAITTWRYDGHPDHEATARACAGAARTCGARLLEAPVWGWHWSAPGDDAMPLAHARKLAAPPASLENKRAALACFHSQTTPDASTGAAPILPAFAIERVLHPFELYFDDHE